MHNIIINPLKECNAVKVTKVKCGLAPPSTSHTPQMAKQYTCFMFEFCCIYTLGLRRVQALYLCAFGCIHAFAYCMPKFSSEAYMGKYLN